MADQAQTLREMMRDTPNRDGATAARSVMPTTDVGDRTRIITVASGKGGVGKTNISTNLAIAYAKLGKRVVLMDMDLGLGNVNVVLGIIPKYTLYHVVKKQKRLSDIILDTSVGIRFVAGASGFAKIANLDEQERQAFIDELSGLSDADVIIIDTSAGVSNNVLAFVAAADEAIIVTTPEPTAITDAYGIIKIITTEIDDLNLSLKLIVNRVASVVEGRRVAERVTSIAGQFLNLKVDYLGYVYDDEAVSQAVRKQRPFYVSDPKSKAAVCITQIVNRLENIDYREGSGIGGFLKRLFGRAEGEGA
jgi:flagellar biosynthesis protein FlhG